MVYNLYIKVTMNNDLSIENESSENELSRKNKTRKTLLIICIVLFVGLIIAGIVFLAILPYETTARIRDIFLVLLALEMLFVGIAMVILIIQMASLTSMLQNEIKPMINSTTDTVNTLRGTVRFLSNNFTEPVIRMNQTLASLNKLLELFKFRK